MLIYQTSSINAKFFFETLYFLQNKLYAGFARKGSIFITAGKYLYPPSGIFPTRGKKKEKSLCRNLRGQIHYTPLSERAELIYCFRFKILSFRQI
jgi:hypothetical protein